MDEIITIDNSTVHHGKHNDRAYIMSFSEKDSVTTIADVEILANENGYSKIVAKVPDTKVEMFKKAGYIIEGVIENADLEKYCFVSRYLTEDRKFVNNIEEIKDVLMSAVNAAPKKEADDYLIRPLGEDDIKEQIEIYKEVFESYPFPIYRKDFIMETMMNDVCYYGVFDDDKMIASASADIDEKTGCAEMTDFATLPDHRGKGFAVSLLERMEKDLLKRGISSFFTIARSVSYGMNKTFARRGYSYTGTLFNNTNINGSIESMNIWYKIA